MNTMSHPAHVLN